MKTPEEFLESQGIGNLSITDYISKEGYVWKSIVKAMLKYGDELAKDAYNQALEDAAENAEADYCGMADVWVDKDSILKLKKQ